MLLWKKCGLISVLILLISCTDTPRHAQIFSARLLPGVAGLELDLTQQIQLTPVMREALEHGIALRLLYRINVCGHPDWRALWLRHAPLNHQYELQHEGAVEVRGFPRLASMEAALDRVRLPLDLPQETACSGRVQVQLDLAALPTPLRFPAFFAPEQWHLVSAEFAWPAP